MSLPNLEPVDLQRATILLNHGPTVLVTSAHAGRRNVMAAAWAMPLDFNPPKVLVVVDKSAWTRELMEASGEFTLCVPPREQATAVLKVGGETGREQDKFAASGLKVLPGSKVGAPLIEGSLACLECRIVPEPHNQQQYDLFIGEVVVAWADPKAFSANRWHFDEDLGSPRRSIHYVAGGAFFATGQAFQVD
jgi:flavin reductase (DIM6/NTAB) family NADH-FMN oxidoreductase RutF